MTETRKATEQLREEFNRWAVAGRGEDMERDHRRIAEQMLALMQLGPEEKILDVGCGAGWLERMMAPLVPLGRLVGLDVSDEMLRRARSYAAPGQASFILGSAEAIPWESEFFTRAVSIESAYYWPRPARGLEEIFRVLCAGASAWILINYYRDNPYCHQWGKVLSVPAHLLGAEEWAALFREAGFAGVAHRFIPDDTPAPEVYTGKWFRDADELRRFREFGALLVHGTKP
jgi:ubiquinone/menaquinone biosynthesis C-methylase UbiE